MALTLTTLAMGGAVFLGTQNLRAAITAGFDQSFAGRRFDFSVRLNGRLPPDSLEALIAATPGVAAVEAWSGASATVVQSDGTPGHTFSITAPPAGTRLLKVALRAGRWLVPNDGRALVVSGNLAASQGLDVGDEVTLAVAGRQAAWQIVGVGGLEIGAGAAYAARDVVAGMATDGLVSTAMVAGEFHGMASELALIQQVRGVLAGQGFDVLSTTRTEEARRVTEDHLLTVVDFLSVMAWVLIAVGGLALASTMGLAVLERTREIGVMRAIGARHRTILAIVQIEAVVIGLLSWVVALPLSIPMSLILEAVFSRIFLTLPPTVVPDGRGVVIWLGLVVVVAIGASAMPALRATRITTAQALAYD